jgi:hypothetical protein
MTCQLASAAQQRGVYAAGRKGIQDRGALGTKWSGSGTAIVQQPVAQLLDDTGTRATVGPEIEVAQRSRRSIGHGQEKRAGASLVPRFVELTWGTMRYLYDAL